MSVRVRTRFQEQRDAVQVLADRYATPLMSTCDAVNRVAGEAGVALERPDVVSPPPVAALLAGITALDSVALLRDWQELVLIDAARTGGASWADIGAAMGYRSAVAKQGAKGRFDRLVARHPGFHPTSTKEAPDVDPEDTSGQQNQDRTEATAPAGRT